MPCYKDRTFCNSDCVNEACHRHFGDAEWRSYVVRRSHDPDHAPIAFSDFSSDCDGYLEPSE